MKEKYTDALLEIVCFDAEDIITSSINPEPDELPPQK